MIATQIHATRLYEVTEQEFTTLQKMFKCQEFCDTSRNIDVQFGKIMGEDKALSSINPNYSTKNVVNKIGDTYHMYNTVRKENGFTIMPFVSIEILEIFKRFDQEQNSETLYEIKIEYSNPYPENFKRNSEVDILPIDISYFIEVALGRTNSLCCGKPIQDAEIPEGSDIIECFEFLGRRFFLMRYVDKTDPQDTTTTVKSSETGFFFVKARSTVNQRVKEGLRVNPMCNITEPDKQVIAHCIYGNAKTITPPETNWCAIYGTDALLSSMGINVLDKVKILELFSRNVYVPIFNFFATSVDNVSIESGFACQGLSTLLLHELSIHVNIIQDEPPDDLSGYTRFDDPQGILHETPST